MQTDNRFLDDLAKLATGAAGALTSMRGELEASVRAWLDRRLSELDLVPRDEFEAVKEMAARARAENERLAERIAALEAAGTPAPGGTRKATSKPKTGPTSKPRTEPKEG